MKATLTTIDTAASTRPRAATLPPEGTTLRLARTRGASVRGVLGWRLRALQGEVWITQDGDIRDIVLEPGQEYIVDRPGPVLLWTLGDADACLAIRPRDASVQRPAPIPAGHPAFA